jgi:acetyl-CoA carboxylase biotin carboxyl carrier protein
LDLDELKEILKVLDERGIAEFELEREGIKLRVCKASAQPAAAVPASSPPHERRAPWPGNRPSGEALPAPSGAEPEAPKEPEEAGEVVKSPIVGTFYRAPAPDAPPFVERGDHVRIGQVVCIVEAMKLMNEIEAEVEGEITKVHVENGQPVQYGQPLFAVRPA